MDEIDAIFKERFTPEAVEPPLADPAADPYAVAVHLDDDEPRSVAIQDEAEPPAEVTVVGEVGRVGVVLPADRTDAPAGSSARSQPRSRRARPTLRQFAAFAAIWLLCGFTGGTATLMGPVRWVALLGRDRGFSAEFESILVRAIIVCLVLSSAGVALWLTRIALRSPTAHVRAGVPALVLACATASVWLWLSPALMGGSAADSSVGSSFTFGSYATEDKLVQLKTEGYTAVISLLHPAVVPFETRLIAEGKAAARRVGLDYIHLPMLPWISDNRGALDRLTRLIESGTGRYYVHCYLGQDRIRIARRVVEEHLPTARSTATLALAAHAERRRLADLPDFERGNLIRVDDGVFLGPYPTNDEFLSYVLADPDQSVVSLLDPANPDDRPWIDSERELLEGNRKALIELPLAGADYDPQAVLDAARTVARMPRPVLVHAFLAADSGRSPTAEGFLQAFRSNLPPLAPSLFDEPLARGPVQVIAPNVAAGPRPEGPEFGARLARSGVRGFVFAGPQEAAEAVEDSAILADAGLSWRAVHGERALRKLLARGGPWYVYGPLLAAQRDALAQALGPPVPESMLWNPISRTTLIARSARDFFRQVLPEIRSIVLLGPLFLLFGAAAAAFSGWLRQTRGVRAPYTRKIFHFIVFTVAGLLQLTGGLPVVALYGGVIGLVVLYGVWRGAAFGFYEALARPSDAPKRTLFVLVPLATTALGGLSTNLLFGPFASIGYLVAGWGDAIAEPVGTAWGRHRYTVPSLAGVPATRSLEGSAAVLVVGSLAAALGLALGGFAPATALAIGLACGGAGALVEAFSNHGLDNFTVQFAAAGVAFLLLA